MAVAIVLDRNCIAPGTRRKHDRCFARLATRSESEFRHCDFRDPAGAGFDRLLMLI